MDEMAIDFTQYLSERLGLSEADTYAVLGAWLKTYEPVSGAERPSQVSLAKTCEGEPALAQTA
jgi:hypothetical protein